jgi:hypothetical protein
MDWLESLRSDALEFYAVTGERLYKSTGSAQDEHQVMAGWSKVVAGGEYNPIDVNLIEIEVEGGQYGTDDWLLETASDAGQYPTAEIFLGRKEDFFIYPTDALKFDQSGGNAVDDSGQIRYLKTPISNHLGSQDVTAVAATTFDLDDATMCPDGTLSREWGSRAPTLYELFDSQAGATVDGTSAPDYSLVSDVDIAMGAILDGTATADQLALCEHLDIVLGFMVDQGISYYNDQL